MSQTVQWLYTKKNVVQPSEAAIKCPRQRSIPPCLPHHNACVLVYVHVQCMYLHVARLILNIPSNLSRGRGPYPHVSFHMLVKLSIL